MRENSFTINSSYLKNSPPERAANFIFLPFPRFNFNKENTSCAFYFLFLFLAFISGDKRSKENAITAAPITVTISSGII